MFRPTRILVPTDFSEYSDKAFLQALDIARHYGSTVHLFHVVNDEVQQCSVDYCLDSAVVEQLKADILAQAQEKIASELGKFPEATGVNVVVAIGRGKPYQAILQEVKEKDVDLIVLASLGKSGVAHVIIGSVARHILREAKCSVLLTK